MPGLFEFNPVPHVAWLVGGGIMILLGIALLLDGFDWIHDRLRRRTRGPDLPSSERSDSWRLEEPESAVRERHQRRIVSRWYWQRSDKPDHSNATPKRSDRVDGGFGRR